MAKKKKTLKEVPSYYELLSQVRGGPIPAPKKIRSNKDKANTRQARKAETRKEIQNYK